jgi:exodeoxyribonuclease-3
MLTVTSVNVNGLRAAAKKGFVEWLADTSADVLCLQEVRAEPQQLPEHVRTPASPSTVAVSPTGYRSASARRSSTPAAGTSRPTCRV